MLLVKVFAVVPLLALVAAVPVAWGWGLGWVDIGLALFFYTLTCLGVTIGFHRHFTHGAFKANRGLRIALAAVGSMAMQGPVVNWVADHRRHHAYADKEGDPHSPWLFGTSAAALAKGFWHAHLAGCSSGNAPTRDGSPQICWPTTTFNASTGCSRCRPWSPCSRRRCSAACSRCPGGGAVTAFFWASLVRVAVLHHVTWSVNSICHLIGKRPFEARDKSANFWPLAHTRTPHPQTSNQRHNSRPRTLDQEVIVHVPTPPHTHRV